MKTLGITLTTITPYKNKPLLINHTSITPYKNHNILGINLISITLYKTPRL